MAEMETKSIKMCQEILHTEQMGYLRLYHASCLVKHLQPEVTLEIQEDYSLQSMQSLTWKFILRLFTQSQNSPECNTDQLYGPGCRPCLSKISIKACDDYLIFLWSTIWLSSKTHCYHLSICRVMHPQIQSLDWIQCDLCKKWLASDCAGISLETITEETSFSCGYDTNHVHTFEKYVIP